MDQSNQIYAKSSISQQTMSEEAAESAPSGQQIESLAQAAAAQCMELYNTGSLSDQNAERALALAAGMDTNLDEERAPPGCTTSGFDFNDPFFYSTAVADPEQSVSGNAPVNPDEPMLSIEEADGEISSQNFVNLANLHQNTQSRIRSISTSASTEREQSEHFEQRARSIVVHEDGSTSLTMAGRSHGRTRATRTHGNKTTLTDVDEADNDAQSKRPKQGPDATRLSGVELRSVSRHTSRESSAIAQELDMDIFQPGIGERTRGSVARTWNLANTASVDLDHVVAPHSHIANQLQTAGLMKPPATIARRRSKDNQKPTSRKFINTNSNLSKAPLASDQEDDQTLEERYRDLQSPEFDVEALHKIIDEKDAQRLTEATAAAASFADTTINDGVSSNHSVAFSAQLHSTSTQVSDNERMDPGDTVSSHNSILPSFNDTFIDNRMEPHSTFATQTPMSPSMTSRSVQTRMMLGDIITPTATIAPSVAHGLFDERVNSCDAGTDVATNGSSDTYDLTDETNNSDAGVFSTSTAIPSVVHRLIEEHMNLTSTTSIAAAIPPLSPLANITNNASGTSRGPIFPRIASFNPIPYEPQQQVYENQIPLYRGQTERNGGYNVPYGLQPLPHALQSQPVEHQAHGYDFTGASQPSFLAVPQQQQSSSSQYGLQTQPRDTQLQFPGALLSWYGFQAPQYGLYAGQSYQRQFNPREAEMFSIDNLNRLITAITLRNTDQSNSSANQASQSVSDSQGPAPSQAQAGNQKPTRKKGNLARYSSAVHRSSTSLPPPVSRENLPREWPQPPQFTNSAGVLVENYYMKRINGGRPRKAITNESAEVLATRELNMTSKRASRDREQALKDRDRARESMREQLMSRGAQGFQDWIRTANVSRVLPATADHTGCYVDSKSVQRMSQARIATGQYAGTADGSSVPIESVMLGNFLVGGYFGPPRRAYRSPYPRMYRFFTKGYRPAKVQRDSDGSDKKA